MATGATARSVELGSRPFPDSAGAPLPCLAALSAKQAYERTWRAVRGHFGAAGMPAPRLRFSARPIREMQVQESRDGGREVVVFAVEREALAGKRGCREARSARQCLIHEFVHVYQAEPYASGEVRPDVVLEAVPEGLAEARAQALMRKVYGLNRSEYDTGVWAVYSEYAHQVRERYRPKLIRRGQFGGNWGSDPRQIPWREPNPVLG